MNAKTVPPVTVAVALILAAMGQRRRTHPRWGQRRIEFGLGRNGCPGPISSLSTIYRGCWCATARSTRSLAAG